MTLVNRAYFSQLHAHIAILNFIFLSRGSALNFWLSASNVVCKGASPRWALSILVDIKHDTANLKFDVIFLIYKIPF